MLPIVISLSISLVGVLAAVLLVRVAMRGREEEPEPDLPTGTSTPAGSFFMDENAGPLAQFAVSPEVLRERLERHVRSEHEAAEAFLEALNAESLHAPKKAKPRG